MRRAWCWPCVLRECSRVLQECPSKAPMKILSGGQCGVEKSLGLWGPVPGRIPICAKSPTPNGEPKVLCVRFGNLKKQKLSLHQQSWVRWRTDLGSQRLSLEIAYFANERRNLFTVHVSFAYFLFHDIVLGILILLKWTILMTTVLCN